MNFGLSITCAMLREKHNMSILWKKWWFELFFYLDFSFLTVKLKLMKVF